MNTLETVRAIATKVVIVLVEPVSSDSAGGFRATVGEYDEDEDEAIIRDILGFVSERQMDFEEFAEYDEGRKKWNVEAEIADGRSTKEDDGVRWYEVEFLVVATKETNDPFISKVEGLSGFKGQVIRSTKYKSDKGFEKKKVLVGVGNCGMESPS
ncbi:hypothetical protein L6452_34487 [Arctium lappa]|uniref:Uncharacterized protein n=1 Tax=Arctium lappa TaxID=4217 RepID=A0ACB8YIV6_ARCLA|nr:hypothetical protein L6452_34487 [Arctium lappa]